MDGLQLPMSDNGIICVEKEQEVIDFLTTFSDSGGSFFRFYIEVLSSPGLSIMRYLQVTGITEAFNLIDKKIIVIVKAHTNEETNETDVCLYYGNYSSFVEFFINLKERSIIEKEDFEILNKTLTHLYMTLE